MKKASLAMLVLPAALLALALAACGSADSSRADLGVPEDATVMDQDNLKFEPSELTVDAGDEVYFINSETAVHNVAIDGEDVSGQMRHDDVFRFTFESPGSYEITCDYHPQMRARIIVE